MHEVTHLRSERKTVTQIREELQKIEAEGYGNLPLLIYSAQHPDQWVSPRLVYNPDDEGEFIEGASPDFLPNPPNASWTQVDTQDGKEDMVTLIGERQAADRIAMFGSQQQCRLINQLIVKALEDGKPIILNCPASRTIRLNPPVVKARFMLSIEPSLDFPDRICGVVRASDDKDEEAVKAGMEIDLVYGEFEDDIASYVRRLLHSKKLIAHAEAVEISVH